MKILYCVHDPSGYARSNFWASFAAMGIELIDFDFAAEAAARGRDGMLHELERLVASERPELLFHSIIDDELSPDLLDRLRDASATTTVVFFSDDDWRLEHSLRHVAHYNVAITNDGSALPVYQRLGHAHVRQVQYAANPAMYHPRPVPTRYDVTFVGQPYAGRPEMIRSLRARGIDVRVWGTGWERFSDLRPIAGGVLPTEVMIETICASRIVLGLAWCSSWDGKGRPRPQIKGRTFEYAACEAFQLTLEDPRLAQYFEIGREIDTYRDADDLAHKIEHYLTREVDRGRMAEAARRRVLAEHTWEQRWGTFLADLAAHPLPGKRPIVPPAPPRVAAMTQTVAARPAPAVSVVTHVYNYGDYVDEMVRSVLAQTFADWELVILDDGSTDDTPARLQPHLADPRVRYIRQDNIGHTGRYDLVLRRALAHARGDLIAFIGGDDVCLPERLARQVEEFRRDPALDVLHTNGHHVGPDGSLLPTDFHLHEPYDAWSHLRILFRKNMIAHPTVTMRRRALERMGSFDEAYAADYRFWLKSARFLRYRFLDEKLIAYRIHPRSLSTSASGQPIANREAERLKRLMRPLVTILDLYPELDRCADPERALAAAYTDLGNIFLTGDAPLPDLALAEYERALDHAKPAPPATLHNVAVAMALLGSPVPARQILDQLVAAGYRPATATRAVVAGDRQDALSLADAREVSAEIWSIPRPPRSDAPSAANHAGEPVPVPARPDPSAPREAAEPAPLVSVIVPTRNRLATLREALASLAAQTLRDFEVLVVNDGGESVEPVLDEFRGRLRLRSLAHPEQRERSAARNTGLGAARGRYVAYLDDDDVYYPMHLATLVAALASPGTAVAYTDAVRLRYRIEGGARIDAGRDVPWSTDFSRDRLLHENYIPVCCVMHERACLAEVGDFDTALSRALEDWDLWIRLSRRWEFRHVAAATCEFRECIDPEYLARVDRSPFYVNAQRIFAKYADLAAGQPHVRQLQLAYLAGLKQIEAHYCGATAPESGGAPVAEDAGPDVSIVIPAWNNLELTRNCLTAIARNTRPGRFEVIVVDNGSTDDTGAFLRREMAEGRVRAVFNRKNLGFARGCNQGARLAEGRYVLFLNNDTLPRAGWLDALLATADADPTIGVLGAKLLYPDGTIQHAGIVVGRRDGEPAPYHVYLCQPADAPWVNRPRELQMVTGACLMIDRELFESLGGFDQEYWNGHEDLDLCLRARERGRTVVYCPGSVVTHLESRTKQLMGLDQFHYAKGVDNEEGRGRRRFLQRWGATLEIDDECHYAADGVRVASESTSLREAPGLAHLPSAGAQKWPPHSPNAQTTVAERQPAGPLHVLFTMYGWTEEGGGTILPRQIARALVRRGHRVSVIYAAARTRPDKPPYHVEEHEEAGVRLLAVYNRPALFCDPEHPERDADDPELRRITAGLIERLRPDIVHYHSLLGFSMSLPEDVSRAGIASVYTSHNYWPLCPRMYLIQEDLNLCGGPSEDGAKCAACMGRFDKQAAYARRAAVGREMLGRHVDRHLAVSRRVRELFVRNGHTAERIAVLHQQPETADEIHRRAGNAPSLRPVGGPLRIGFIGSLLPQKGAHVLVRALQAFQPGEIEAHVWGGGPQPYVETLQRMDAKRLAKLHGAYALDRLPEILREVDVVVVPSIWEDCAPLVVAEVLAAGVPVVGSRIGGIPDFVEDGATGLLFDPRDAIDLAATLSRLKREPALLDRLRAGIQRRRDFDAYLDELLGHYRQVITGRARTAAMPAGTSGHIESSTSDARIVAGPAGVGEDRGPGVLWEGSFFLHHSLASINRAVCAGLLDRGVDLGLVNFEKPTFDPLREPATRTLAQRVGHRPAGPIQVHVRHRYPPDFSRPQEGRLAVILPWEFGPAPTEWVEGIRQSVDELWVPSAYVKDCFVRSGVAAERVAVIPNGFDPALLRPDAAAMPLPTAKRFRFLYVGTGLGRKGFDVLLQAYLEEFSAADDVTLIIKDQAYYSQRLDALVARHGGGAGAPEILYFGADVLPRQMAGFYGAADCLVHPFRGEGFGLPILEAMACGRPVIVTDHGPVREFCPDDAGWFIPCRTVTSPEPRVEHLRTTAPPVWAEPDRAALRALMRNAVDNPDDCRRRGARAADAAHARFTWADVAGRYAERVAALAQAPAPAAAGVAPLVEDGLALLESEQTAEAAHLFLTAARIEPTSVPALTGLAHCTLALGDNRSARLLLQEILALDPGHAGARGALSALEADETLEDAPSPR